MRRSRFSVEAIADEKARRGREFARMLGKHVRHLMRNEVCRLAVGRGDRRAKFLSDKEPPSRHRGSILVALAADVDLPMKWPWWRTLVHRGRTQASDNTVNPVKQRPISIEIARRLKLVQTLAISALGKCVDRLWTECENVANVQQLT